MSGTTQHTHKEVSPSHAVSMQPGFGGELTKSCGRYAQRSATGEVTCFGRGHQGDGRAHGSRIAILHQDCRQVAVMCTSPNPRCNQRYFEHRREKAWTQTAATTREDETGPSKRKTGARFGYMHSVVTLISRITPTSLAINFATKNRTVTQLARHRAGVVST